MPVPVSYLCPGVVPVSLQVPVCIRVPGCVCLRVTDRRKGYVYVSNASVCQPCDDRLASLVISS